MFLLSGSILHEQILLNICFDFEVGLEFDLKFNASDFFDSVLC